MKSLDTLYAELGLTQGQTKTASTSKEDALLETLRKLAGTDSPDPEGSQKVPVNLGDAAANRENGTTDPSQVLNQFNSREDQPEMTSASTMNSSSIPAMSQGSTSHKLNEVPLQAPAQAKSVDTSTLEVIASKVASILRAQQPQQTPDVDLDQIYKVAMINDYLGRASAQMNFAKHAQEMDAGLAQAAPEQVDPTADILGVLGQASADDLVAKKDELLMAIADVLDTADGEEMSEEAMAEEQVKEAANHLLGIIGKNPHLKTKVAQMLGK